MDATDVPAKKDSSWRSFAIFGVGLFAVAGAFINLVASEGGSGAFRLLMSSFLVLVASLLAGLVVDWRRLDWLTKVVQTLALVGCVVMLVGVWITFPDVLRLLWDS
jgi:hypothetical protein